MQIDEQDVEETPGSNINKALGGFGKNLLDLDRDQMIEEAQNESKSEVDGALTSNRSATSSMRVRRTLFNANNQGNYDLKKDKLTEDNVEKEFGEKSKKSNNRNYA